MILADKIINERKKLGLSQEELADKLEVSRQAVSKWESAQSTPDLNRILMMSKIFGVSTDYLLKDEIEQAGDGELTEYEGDYSPKKLVTMETATSYIDAVERTNPFIALGVSLCIASPAVMMALSTLSQYGRCSDNIASVGGIVILLFMVAAGVFIFITTDKDLKPFEYIEKEEIDTAYGVDGMLREKKSRLEKRKSSFIAVGVIMCILSCVPLLATSMMNSGGELTSLMVGVLLIMVSVGVNMIIRGNAVVDACNKVLQEEDYTPSGKRLNKITGKVASIYWPIIVAVFLGVSFLTDKWETTWIIWPVAAVLFGAIAGIIKAVRDK
ncbi:helix-turn-helix domain-containing protein [Butyrivibrio sp. AE2005]|uniref:helix-turn-helix domain-containing protein n=1 Tax=Butyrivibrio sp. AE2005 TaxID=1496722 RepID=UPI00047BA3C2|nr:helix-turn-helix transcriptional regulator [Butyrivibrio sp. AE2005]